MQVTHTYAFIKTKEIIHLKSTFNEKTFPQCNNFKVAKALNTSLTFKKINYLHKCFIKIIK